MVDHLPKEIQQNKTGQINSEFKLDTEQANAANLSGGGTGFTPPGGHNSKTKFFS